MKQKSSRGAATRQKILEAAAQLVSKKGFNGTSVDDVLAASGTGKSQFYHYFDSKTQLARELVEHHLPAMPLALLADPEKLTGVAQIEAALDGLVAGLKEGRWPQGCAIGNLATELASGSEELGQGFKDLYAGLETKLAEAIRRLRFRGQLRNDVVPEEVASFVAASLQGAMLLAKIHGGAAPLEATVAQLKPYLRALGAKQQGASRALPTPRSLTTSWCP